MEKVNAAAVGRLVEFLSENANEILAMESANSATGQELSELILALGVPAWESGYDKQGRFYLALSADLCEGQLRKNKKILAAMPSVAKNIYLYPFRPAKNWDGYFDYRGSSWKDSDWKYKIFKYGDGVYEIALIFEGLDMLDAARFALISEIGEDQYIDRIYISSIPLQADDAHNIFTGFIGIMSAIT